MNGVTSFVQAACLRTLPASLCLMALGTSQMVHAANYALSPDGNAVVRLESSTPLASSSFNTSLITSAYAGWTVNTSGGAAGSIATTKYAAGWDPAIANRGGGIFEATYSQAGAVASGHSLQWVQVINTNIPQPGVSSPYIDPQPNDDALPFYWTGAEQPGFSTSKSTRIKDFSQRYSTSLSSTNPITWSADLYAADYDGNKTVTVGNGIRWGWNMKPATVGHSTGTFTGPSPACPPATCSGIGSSSISWGQGSPGSLSFAGAAFAPKVGDAFKLGTLSYHNGSTTTGSEISGITLDIAMSFDNISEANFTMHTPMSIVNSPNTDDPIASADFVSMTGFPYTFNVLEGASASVDVMAKLTPKLKLTPAGVGGGAPGKNPATDFLSGPQGYELTFMGFANPTTGGFVPNVPEPSEGLLVLSGLVVVGTLAKRKTTRRQTC